MITATHRAEHIAAPSSHSGNVLDREIRDVMTPGVVSIVENASLQQVYRAMIAHRVHAILVVGRTQGRPIGWVTARGLLAWIGRDDSLSCARDAVTESPA